VFDLFLGGSSSKSALVSSGAEIFGESYITEEVHI